MLLFRGVTGILKVKKNKMLQVLYFVICVWHYIFFFVLPERRKVGELIVGDLGQLPLL